MKKHKKGRIELGNGESCPRCSKTMKRFKHGQKFKPHAGQVYFSYWDICFSCNRVQNYEAAKISGAKSDVAVATATPKSFTGSFYRSWEWKKLRYEVLKESGPRCECCGATPDDGARIVVDHIKPIRQFWQLRLVKSNCQVLCNDCNMGKAGDDFTDWSLSNIVPFPNINGV